jgi:hypothetical protein
METSGELVRLLMRLGYWSTWNGLYAEAATLFQGARAARPQSEIPVLGMAVLAMVMHKPEAAVQLLRESAVPLNPASELVEAHVGCALRLAGSEDEGMEILSRLSATAKDESARSMAASLVSLKPEYVKTEIARVL